MSTERELCAAVERFIASCRRPALLEPGEELLELAADNHSLEARGTRVTLQAWDRHRNIVRRVREVRSETPGRLELAVERFGRREGRLFLLDLDRPAGFEAGRRSARFVFRERFRHLLAREYPGWTVAELSCEANLQYSLSPAYPRAYLRKGQSGWAAIASAPGAGEGVLSFGLIWLDYLRQRERRTAVEGLAVFVPAGEERAARLRLRHLDSGAARFELFSYSPQGYAARIDPDDVGNFDTHLAVCRGPNPLPAALAAAADVPGVERVARTDGGLSLRVRGLEFAQADEASARFGLADRLPAGEGHAAEIERLARELVRVRSAAAADREHPLYRQSPEAWLESQVRAHLETVDATLAPGPLYSQVLGFAGGERGAMDLLAADRSGRLAILELKASADLHLPLQALDYWMRVRWHLERGEFAARGYFPGVMLRPEAPRLLLVSPALEFHPTTECILGYFSPSIDVERIGVGVEWRKGIEVMFRLRGAERPR